MNERRERERERISDAGRQAASRAQAAKAKGVTSPLRLGQDRYLLKQFRLHLKWGGVRVGNPVPVACALSYVIAPSR